MNRLPPEDIPMEHVERISVGRDYFIVWYDDGTGAFTRVDINNIRSVINGYKRKDIHSNDE